MRLFPFTQLFNRAQLRQFTCFSFRTFSSAQSVTTIQKTLDILRDKHLNFYETALQKKKKLQIALSESHLCILIFPCDKMCISH